jgi:hypothetical protein
MSERHRSTAMVTTRPSLARLLSLQLLAAAILCLLVAAAAGMLATRVMADPPSGVTRFTAEEAARAGVALEVTAASVADEVILEIAIPAAERLLDVTPDASLIAVADEIGPAFSALSIRHADDSIVRVELPGLLDAAFAPDASWLAVLDGHGSLLQLDPATGRTEMLVEGPFTGPVRFTRDGSLLLRAVSSIHAPFVSELVMLDATSGERTTLSGDELVYAAFETDDGSIVYAAHERGEGTVVMRAGLGTRQRIAYLGPDAIEVDVSGSGAIAFAVAGDGVYLIDPAGSVPRRIGPGGKPSFSPDGEELLVVDAGRSMVIGLDGSLLAQTGGHPVAWACEEGCDR